MKKMSFLNSFESKKDGVNDTVEFVIRVAIVTLSAVILVVVLALVVGLFMPNDVIESAAILEMVNPAFQTIIGALVGLLGGLSLNANARDKEPEEVAPEPEPEYIVSHPVTSNLVVSQEAPIVEDNDDDDDMEPWEKYRNDLRYDANGDGVVDESDFPDWRSAGK
jgi:ABC-type nickel/cobalt efflux system permease component RcnA